MGGCKLSLLLKWRVRLTKGFTVLKMKVRKTGLIWPG